MLDKNEIKFYFLGGICKNLFTLFVCCAKALIELFEGFCFEYKKQKIKVLFFVLGLCQRFIVDCVARLVVALGEGAYSG